MCYNAVKHARNAWFYIYMVLMKMSNVNQPVYLLDKEKATKHLWSVMAIATTLIIGIWLLYSLLTSWTSLVGKPSSS